MEGILFRMVKKLIKEKISEKRNVIRLILILAIVTVMIVSIPSGYANAASNKSKSTEEGFWFVVPNGGHSSATIRLTYREYYSLKDNKTNFSKRTRSVLFRRAGATVMPKYGYGILKHSNGKTFSKWSKQDVVYGAPWDSGSSYVNTTKVTYSRTTSVKGTLNATVSCSGAAVPTRAVSVTQKLNTK